MNGFSCLLSPPFEIASLVAPRYATQDPVCISPILAIFTSIPSCSLLMLSAIKEKKIYSIDYFVKIT